MWFKLAMLVAGLATVLAGIVPFVSSMFGSDTEDSLMTYTVRLGDVVVTITENGMLESSNNEEIKCLVKGGSTVLWVIETGTIVQPGDVLVRLDTSLIIDKITQQQITYERAVANQIIANSEVAVAKTNIEEYVNGTFLEERSTIEKQIFDSQEQVKKTQLAYESALRLASKGMFRSLQIEGEQFARDSARKDLELKTKQLQTLDLYKKKKTMQQLQSALDAAAARLAAENASLRLEKDRLDRDKEQLDNCVIKAPAAGMVIFPSAAEWKQTPDIEEGAGVREQQTLLMIPDVSSMQVKVGVHESKVSKLKIGMAATIELQDLTLDGSVSEIAEVTRPAGWWTGNMVKYDTMIHLDPQPGLKPGMSAVVDIAVAEYRNVLKIPVAAILETEQGYLCWVKSSEGVKKRVIELGGTNDEFTVVTAGLAQGDEVVLNPMAFVEEAQIEALKPKSQADTDSDANAAANSGANSDTDAEPTKKPLKEKAGGGGKKDSATS